MSTETSSSPLPGSVNSPASHKNSSKVDSQFSSSRDQRKERSVVSAASHGSKEDIYTEIERASEGVFKGGRAERRGKTEAGTGVERDHEIDKMTEREGGSEVVSFTANHIS